MRFESLYIIRPTEALKKRLEQIDPDVAQMLSEPRLWTKSEGGRTAWTDKDNRAQIKLLFLLRLWSDYVVGASADDRLKACLENMLGIPPFSEDLFDHWWEVERFDGVDECFEEVEHRLSLDQPHLLANSPLPRVEAWLSDLASQEAVASSAP